MPQALNESVYTCLVLVFGDQLHAAIRPIPNGATNTKSPGFAQNVGTEAHTLHMTRYDSANRVHLVRHSTWRTRTQPRVPPLGRAP